MKEGVRAVFSSLRDWIRGREFGGPKGRLSGRQTGSKHEKSTKLKRAGAAFWGGGILKNADFWGGPESLIFDVRF